MSEQNRVLRLVQALLKATSNDLITWVSQDRVGINTMFKAHVASMGTVILAQQKDVITFGVVNPERKRVCSHTTNDDPNAINVAVETLFDQVREKIDAEAVLDGMTDELERALEDLQQISKPEHSVVDNNDEEIILRDLEDLSN